MQALLETRLDLANRRAGKVRDIYDVTVDGQACVLIVTTDRVSAFDVVMANGIPGRGRLLTAIAAFWFRFFADEVEHHLLSTEVADVPGLGAAERERLAGRVMLCRSARVLPVECIVRGYLVGSGFKDYQADGRVCGIALPDGLVHGSRLDEPLFTPSTKADRGHDENVDYATAAELVGEAMMARMRDLSLHLYCRGREYAARRGILVADTKFEFGIASAERDAQPMLVDEVLTPDSSRFWPADDWRPGGQQPSFDKQFVRDYLSGLTAEGQWDGRPPGPVLPDHIVRRTLERYEEALRRLTG